LRNENELSENCDTSHSSRVPPSVRDHQLRTHRLIFFILIIGFIAFSQQLMFIRY